MTKEEDDKAQQGKPRSYSKFEKCIMLLIAKFFSKEKDINKFGEWLEKYLKGDDKIMTNKEKSEKEVMERIIIGEQIEIDRLEKEKRKLEQGNEQLKAQIEGLEKENGELRVQIEGMKCCANCFHNNKPSDKEYCWNCERQLNDGQPIIKDEWEIFE